MRASASRPRSVGSCAHIAEAVVENVLLDAHLRMASCSNDKPSAHNTVLHMIQQCCRNLPHPYSIQKYQADTVLLRFDRVAPASPSATACTELLHDRSSDACSRRASAPRT